MEEKRVAEFDEWYQKNYSLYDQCGKRAKELLTLLLNQNGLAFHSIDCRIKEKESYLNKCKLSKYTDPINQITDVCGLRIISYTNHDVKEIAKLIDKEFFVDNENTIDKHSEMDADRVGYLSVHYIVRFNSSRTELTEYSLYKDIRFEIQVRTLLQHAWAEIEHDRNYKFGGELPREIKRRFYLLAGMLEIVDTEFDRLSNEIDEYAETVKHKAEQGELDVPIDSTSLIEYLQIKFPTEVIQKDFNGRDKMIIDELKSFGVATLKDLDLIITTDFINSQHRRGIVPNYLGLIRDIMMAHNPKKYFENAWQGHWYACGKNELAELISINPDIKKYAEKLSITDEDN